MNRFTVAAFLLGIVVGIVPCLTPRISDGKLGTAAGGNYLHFVLNSDQDCLIRSELGNLGQDGEESHYVFSSANHLARVRRAAVAAIGSEVVLIYQGK